MDHGNKLQIRWASPIFSSDLSSSRVAPALNAAENDILPGSESWHDRVGPALFAWYVFCISCDSDLHVPFQGDLQHNSKGPSSRKLACAKSKSPLQSNLKNQKNYHRLQVIKGIEKGAKGCCAMLCIYSLDLVKMMFLIWFYGGFLK